MSCETVRSGRRNFPKELFDKAVTKNMNRGDYVEKSKGLIKMITWLDNKPVYIVGSSLPTSVHEVTEVKRQKEAGDQQLVQCPYIITMYNKHMGGVNKNDQLKSYYSIICRSKKWWPRIFFELVDRCVVNSYLLESESPNHAHRTMKLFRIDLVKLLIGEFTSRKACGRHSVETPAKFTERHFPKVLPKNDKGIQMQRGCKVCSKKPKYWCEECDVAVCPAPCFELYHTK